LDTGFQNVFEKPCFSLTKSRTINRHWLLKYKNQNASFNLAESKLTVWMKGAGPFPWIFFAIEENYLWKLEKVSPEKMVAAEEMNGWRYQIVTGIRLMNKTEIKAIVSRSEEYSEWIIRHAGNRFWKNCWHLQKNIPVNRIVSVTKI